MSRAPNGPTGGFNFLGLKLSDLKFQEPVREAKDLRQVLPEEPGQLPAGGGEGLGHLGLLQRGM